MKRIMLFLIMGLFLSSATAFSEGVLRVDKDELKAMLGSPDVVVLDVRAGKDWSSSEFKIKGAVRAPGKDFDTWSASYTPEQTLVLYCA